MSRHNKGDDKPIEHLLGNLLLPGDDGDITDSSVEEFLRLYDELCPSLSSSDLEQVKERTRDAARDTETRQIAAQALETQTAASAAAAAGAGCREMAPPAAAAGSGGAQGGDGGRKEVVQVREMSFHPAELDVASGQEVQWVAVQGSTIKHSLEVFNNWTEEVMAESPPLVPGKPFSWAFPDKGEYTVSSCVYSFMQAKVFVDFPDEEEVEDEDEEEEEDEVPGAQGRRSSNSSSSGAKQQQQQQQQSLLSAAAAPASPHSYKAAPAAPGNIKKPEKGGGAALISGTESPCPPGKRKEAEEAHVEPPSPHPRLSRHSEDGPCSTATFFNANEGRNSNGRKNKLRHESPAAVLEGPGLGASSPLRTPATSSAAASPRGLPIAMTMERPQSPRVPAPQLREPEEAASKQPPSKQAPQRGKTKAAAEAAELHRYRGYEAEAEEDHHPQAASKAQQGAAAADKAIDKAADRAACSPAGAESQPKAETLELQLPADGQARDPPPHDLQQQKQQERGKPAQEPAEEGPSPVPCGARTVASGGAQGAPVAAAVPQSNAAAPHEAPSAPIAATSGSSGGGRVAPPIGKLHRCRSCHSPFISYVNLQRCNARHHANKTLRRQQQQQGRGARGSKGPSSLTLPTRDEFLDFWAKLGPEEAEALLCLRNPGETGEILLQEAAAAGLGTFPPPGLEDAYEDEVEDAAAAPSSSRHTSITGSSSSGPATPRSKFNKSAYRAAAERLFRVVGGCASSGDSAGASLGVPQQPQVLPGEELLRLLHACSEGTVLYAGARARGSLADMMLPANLGASLALLVEGRVVEAWRLQQEAAQREEEAPSSAPVPPKHQNQQKQTAEEAAQQGPEGQSPSSGRRTKPRKPRKKKNRRPGVAEQPGGGTVTEGDTTTTFDEATTTDADATDADGGLQGQPDSPGSAAGSIPLLPLPEADEVPPEMHVLSPAEAHDLPDMDKTEAMEGEFFFEGPPQRQQKQQEEEEEEEGSTVLPAAAAATGQEERQESPSSHQEQPSHPPPAIRFGTVEMDEPIQFGTVDIDELLGGTLDADKVQQQPGLYVLSGAALQAEAAVLSSTGGFLPGVPGGMGHPKPLQGGSPPPMVMIGGPPPGLAPFLPPPGHFVHAAQVVHPYGIPPQQPQQQQEVAIGVPVALGMPQGMPVHHPLAPMVIPVSGMMPHQEEIGAVCQRSPEGGSPPTSHDPSAKEQGAEETRERELSLQQANQYFAGILQQMQQAPSGGSPGDAGQCGEAAEGDTAEREEDESEGEAHQQQQDAAPPSGESDLADQNSHGDEGFSAADEALLEGALEGDEEIAKETLRLQDPLVFDPNLARRLLRQQWLLAVADVQSGIGRRHVSAPSAAATPAVPACKTESALPVQ